MRLPASVLAGVGAVLLSACGGGSKSASICLSRLGVYVDNGVPQTLTVAGVGYPQLDVPTTLTREADLSYGSPVHGANNAQLFFSSDEQTARALAGTFGERRNIERDGKIVIVWSSGPTTEQRHELSQCLA